VVPVAVYLTGEPAEELVESLPTFDHDMVERHEALALGTSVVLVVTAALAALSRWAVRPSGDPTRNACAGVRRRRRRLRFRAWFRRR
jgi:hypothetical protein